MQKKNGAIVQTSLLLEVGKEDHLYDLPTKSRGSLRGGVVSSADKVSECVLGLAKHCITFWPSDALAVFFGASRPVDLYRGAFGIC